jgi:hypothetical protein
MELAELLVKNYVIVWLIYSWNEKMELVCKLMQKLAQ